MKANRSIHYVRLVVTAFFLLGHSSNLPAAIYSVQLDISQFGYLGQSDLPSFGEVASAPIAATNAFVYLQNRFPSIYGTSLTGSDLTSWISTAEFLATPPYMDTIANQQTYNRDTVFGMSEYMNQKAPPPFGFQGQVVIVDGQDWSFSRPLPTGVESVFPTWQSLYASLKRREAPILDVFFPTQPSKRRSVTLTSFHWNDLDGDSWIDISEDGVIDFIDPLDPANDTKTAPKRKFGKIYEESLSPGVLGNRRLRFEFLNDGASPAPSDDAFISMSFTARDPLPEPGSMAIWGLGLLAGWKGGRRRLRQH